MGEVVFALIKELQVNNMVISEKSTLDEDQALGGEAGEWGVANRREGFILSADGFQVVCLYKVHSI